MRDHRMHRVVQVLDEHLPVAVVEKPQAAAGELELALGRAISEVVDGGERVTEVLAKAHSVLRQPGKHEAAVDLDVLQWRQARGRLRLLERGALIALLEWDVDERAVGAVGPGVVGAAERLSRVAS